MLAQLDGTVSAIPPEHSPAVGALLIAWRAAGLPVLPELPEPTPGIVQSISGIKSLN
jgi:hypothetical protein